MQYDAGDGCSGYEPRWRCTMTLLHKQVYHSFVGAPCFSEEFQRSDSPASSLAAANAAANAAPAGGDVLLRFSMAPVTSAFAPTAVADAVRAFVDPSRALAGSFGGARAAVNLQYMRRVVASFILDAALPSCRVEDTVLDAASGEHCTYVLSRTSGVAVAVGCRHRRTQHGALGGPATTAAATAADDAVLTTVSFTVGADVCARVCNDDDDAVGGNSSGGGGGGGFAEPVFKRAVGRAVLPTERTALHGAGARASPFAKTPSPLPRAFSFSSTPTSM
jgi:hypothetical protein